MIFKNKYAHWALLFCCFLAPSIKAAQSEEECQLQQEQDKFLEVLYRFMDENGQLPSNQDLVSHPLVKQLCKDPERITNVTRHMMDLPSLLNSISTEELIELYNSSRENDELNRLIFSVCTEKFNEGLGTLGESLDIMIISINWDNMKRRLFSLAPISEPPAYPTINRLSTKVYMSAVVAILPILNQLGIRSGNMRDIFSNERIRRTIDQTTRMAIQGHLAADRSTKILKEYRFYHFVFHMNDINSSVDDDGRTLLMFCAMMGNLERVRFLCANGARASIKDATGKSALDHAEEFGRHQIRTFLEQQDIQTKIRQLRSTFDTIDSNPKLPDDILALIHQLSCGNEEMATLSSRFKNLEQAKQHYLKLYMDSIRKLLISDTLLSRGVQIPEV